MLEAGESTWTWSEFTCQLLLDMLDVHEAESFFPGQPGL